MTKVPILMYHDVSRDHGKDLTISVKQLDKQFQYLADHGYGCVHFKELLDQAVIPQKKPIIITFDDAYVSQLELALPLLRKYKLKATFFVPLNFIGKTDEWNTSSLKVMSLDQLKSLPSDIVELGFHSFNHKKYTELSPGDIQTDLLQCQNFSSKHHLNFTPVLAYPYGKFPKSTVDKATFQDILKSNGMRLGLRIGNRVNRFPFKKPYEVERIDVKGEWSILKFKHKVRFGKFF